jgi:hypothetical protein
LNGIVQSFESFAGGGFTHSGATALNGIGRWDGTRWSALGTGLAQKGGEVLFAHDDGLYAGGLFDAAGGTPDSNVARWEPNPCVATYCTAGATTSGCQASISATGTPSASLGSGFDVTIASVEGGEAGLIFFALTGPEVTPWSGGSSFLCVGSLRRRTGVQAGSGTPGARDGSLRLDFNEWLATPGGYVPAQGETVWMQGWFRDPPAPGSMNLSDALTFTVCP